MTKATKQGSHFWMMTIQTPNAAGYNVTDYQGTLTPARGATRLDLFNEIREEIYRESPHSRGGVVIAFDVQPNQL
ncbi:hypothetical protein ACIHCX_03620 [Streptomyces sp. NPDC052043]|uniref:hypothetical protein n=1 Tax=Streptomyces sp. NPDC052043 TaxID=3365684 RepID=UPI0037CCD393